MHAFMNGETMELEGLLEEVKEKLLWAAMALWEAAKWSLQWLEAHPVAANIIMALL